jgi:putative membrane protein
MYERQRHETGRLKEIEMKATGIRIAVLCGAAALASGTMYGQTGANGQSGTSGSGSFSAHDKVFLKKSAEGNMAEIQTAQLALQKASSSDVKDFAQKMIDDHTKLADTMKPIMEQAGVAAPAKLNAEDAMMDKRLSGLSGDAFDKHYIMAMVKDHHKDLKEFKMEVASTKNDEMKTTVSQGEQVIQEHVNMIEGIAQKHGVSASHTGAM